MHKGNLLIHQGHIRLIDFSFCAFSDYMFDPAICLSDMRQDLHPAFFKGYQSLRSLPAGYQRLVEGLFIGSMVGAFSYWVPNPQFSSLLLRKVPQITQAYAVKYLHGGHFWF
jgi:Ser/Thr protein kinase RdoA (MazF antagonist)